MIIGLLISILSVSFTVTSSSSVEASGVVPEGMEVSYQRSGTTGQKGQMTAGNNTLLQVLGMDNCIIDSVTLNMRSNKSAGAGSLQMCIGEQEVWTIGDTDFAHVDWNGSFTNEWVDISRRIGAKVDAGEEIKVLIEASKNSLYINSYTFHYTPAEPEAYEVQYVLGFGENPPPSSEESPGDGVVLPLGKDSLEWRFLGWSEEEVEEADTCPKLYAVGERYYPKSDCKLWAVYSNAEKQVPVKDYVSGDYALVNAYWSCAMIGGVNDEVVATHEVEILFGEDGYVLQGGLDAEMMYTLTFLEDSLLTIEHVASHEFIGWDDRILCADLSKWNYRVLEDGSLGIYHMYDNKCYLMFFGRGADASYDKIVVYPAKVALEMLKNDGMWLYTMQEQLFTTWPFGKMDDVENVIVPEFNGENTEYIFYFGNHELHIANGKKWLLIQ